MTFNYGHYPGGVREGSQGLERSVNPWNHRKRRLHPEGMREVEHDSHWALIVALASLQDADPYYIFHQGFALRSNPWLPSETPPG
jgi:hypothetical protein